MKKFTKLFVGSVIALVAVFGATKLTHAAYMQEGTLQMGSTGSQVLALQQTLNMTACKVATSGAGSPGMESTTFGPRTKAAVQCFQSSNGLTTDGVVGPMTGAKLAAVTGSTTVDVGLPQGCASSAGFSTTTGTPCSGTPATTVFPAGCVSSVGFSPTTGVSCATGTASSGVSTGGPLSINQVTAGSGYASTNVGVGATNTQVADLRIVTGAGGSGNLTGLNLTFTNAGTGDFQFTKYASNVSVWYNGVQVGSLPATSFTQYNSAYSAYIPLGGAMLNPATTSDLYIAVSALPVIDSANLSTTANNWAISGVSLRYSDDTGSAFQYSSITTGSIVGAGQTVMNALPNTNFTFNTAASAGSIKLNVIKDINDSTDHTSQVSASSNTQGVTLATIDLDAQNSAVTVSRIPVTIGVVTGAGASGFTNVNQVISTLRLYNSAGVQVDSEAVSGTAACSTFTGSSLAATSGLCATVTFQNFNNTGTSNNGVQGMTLASGATNVFTIKGDINTLSGATFVAGTYAVAELRPLDVTAIQAYDVNDNLLPTNSTYLVGSTTGSKNYFYVNGVNVTSAATPTNSYTSGGNAQSHGLFTMTIPFSVTSYGTTSYVPSVTNLDTTGTINAPTAAAGNYIQYAVDNGTSLLSGATATITYTGNDGLTPDGNGDYQIPVGQTKTFNLVVTYSPTATGQYRAQLVNVNNTQTSGSGYTTYTAGLTTNQFRTPYQGGQ